MPTPVSTARQCLTEEAAHVLDDAAAVARRRSHSQTTSLHAVSALLSSPSSSTLLRDACKRGRSSCFYSPRLQFRALDLSVGVSLDRLPSSKTHLKEEEHPPVSNSLMAAIKRSQGHQRRHPDTFHLLQMPQMHAHLHHPHLLKVELKHFVLSILDDPTVNRVFAEAGFRSCDVKLALLQPPLSQSASRFSRSLRCPPIFLSNLETGLPGFNNFAVMGVDGNCRRIAEVLVRKTKRNPLLMGVYAKGALRSFTESVLRGSQWDVLLPAEIAGLSIICIEKEIAEFLVQSGSEEKMSLKFKELSRAVDQCSGPGVAVSFGELEVLVGGDDEAVPGAAVSFVVSQLTRLLEIHGEKFWLVGVAGTSDACSKFLALFPTVEKDWDLQLLTMTSANPSTDGHCPKSSLMGSFVPFGGFFSTPSEFKNPLRCTNASFTRCDTCKEKCEQEVADILKAAPATLASGNSTSLPWVQKIDVDAGRGLDVAKTNEVKTSLNAKILGFQKKWSDICQRLHHTRSLPGFDISKTRSQPPSLEGFRFGSGFKEGSSKDPTRNEIQYPRQISYMPKDLHSTSPSKQISPVAVPSSTASINTGTDHVPEVSKSQQSDMQSPRFAPSPMAGTTVLDHRSSSSHASVITDLGLGTLCTSAAQEPGTQKLRGHREHHQHFSDTLSTDFDALKENSSHQIAISSTCAGANLEGKFDSVDFKSLNQLLTGKVGWQDEAMHAINRTLYLCKSGAGKRRGSDVRADIWFAFLGPDRLGKMKIASALAEIIYGNTQSLISVDLSSQDRFYSLNSIFECQKSYCHDVLRRKTVVDYIAGELSKKPHSVVFLENVDGADFLVQNSLLQAIRTGKFPDSHGREICINNAIFIITSTVCKGDGSYVSEKESKLFPEERILEAKRCQMQLLLGHASEDAKRSSSTNVKIAERKGFSKPTFLNKRKQVEISDFKEGATWKIQKQVRKAPRSCLDLNMPLEAVEDDNNDNDSESESVVENSEAWLNDLCGQIDEMVVFKAFNFDELAEQVLKSIGILFQRTFGSESQLEIDYEVMAQILAAAWLSDKKNAVEDWVECVLGRSFGESQQKYHPATQYLMKLVSCEAIFVEEQAPGVCLPARINLN